VSIEIDDQWSMITYLSEGTKYVILIVLIGTIANANETIETAQGDKGVHEILILLEHLFERE